MAIANAAIAIYLRNRIIKKKGLGKTAVDSAVFLYPSFSIGVAYASAGDNLSEAEDLLGESEKQTLALRHNHRKDEFLVSRALTKLSYQASFAEQGSDFNARFLAVDKTESGAPYFTSALSDAERFPALSLSHTTRRDGTRAVSGQLCACAMGREAKSSSVAVQQIGVDIEIASSRVLLRRRALEAAQSRFAAVEDFFDRQHRYAPLICWTAIEAYSKASGTALMSCVNNLVPRLASPSAKEDPVLKFQKTSPDMSWLEEGAFSCQPIGLMTAMLDTRDTEKVFNISCYRLAYKRDGATLDAFISVAYR